MKYLRLIILPALFLAFNFDGNAWSQEAKKKKEKTDK